MLMLNFLIYLGVAIPLMIVAVILFIFTTPYKEFEILGKGHDIDNPRNVAAANAVAFDLGGKVFGAALVIASAIFHSVDIIDMAVWGLTGATCLVAVYWLFELLTPGIKVRTEIPNGNVSIGIVSFCLSIAAGLLMAALISY